MGKAVLTAHMQDNYIFLAITDKVFLGAVRAVLKPELLTSSIAAEILQICYDFFDRFGEAPGDHLHDEVVRILPFKKEPDRELYLDYLTKLQSERPPQRSYCIETISSFVKEREVGEALITAAGLLQKGQVAEVQNVLFRALKSGVDLENTGLHYRESKGYAERVIEGPDGFYLDYLCGIGIPPLGWLKLKRGQFVTTLGYYKSGKTWFLMHLAREALLRGLRVLHVSHEVSLDEMELRYDMMLGAFHNKGPDPFPVQYTRWEDYRVPSTEVRPSVLNIAAVKETRRRIFRFGGDLIIKKYPMGSCTMDELERLVNHLEQFEGWSPDVVLNDYADIMAPSPGFERKDTRHVVNEIYVRHKRLADERGILVATVSQINRDGAIAEFIHSNHMSEDIRKAGNVDVALAINQTEAMRKENWGRFHVLLNRSGPMGIYCCYTSCFDTGQFIVDTWEEEKKDAPSSKGKPNSRKVGQRSV